MTDLDPRAREMIDCIRFYADESNYAVSGICEPPTAPIKADGGRRARSLLAQFGVVG